MTGRKNRQKKTGRAIDRSARHRVQDTARRRDAFYLWRRLIFFAPPRALCDFLAPRDLVDLRTMRRVVFFAELLFRDVAIIDKLLGCRIGRLRREAASLRRPKKGEAGRVNLIIDCRVETSRPVPGAGGATAACQPNLRRDQARGL